MQRGKEAAALLEADPTGFLLVEGHIDWLKKQPRLIIGSDSLIPEYVIAGAEFSQKAYQGIYPIAEKFLSRTKQ